MRSHLWDAETSQDRVAPVTDFRAWSGTVEAGVDSCHARPRSPGKGREGFILPSQRTCQLPHPAVATSPTCKSRSLDAGSRIYSWGHARCDVGPASRERQQDGPPLLLPERRAHTLTHRNLQVTCTPAELDNCSIDSPSVLTLVF